MKVIVQKYGGSSLAQPEYIERIADRIIARRNEGYGMVVVTSALGETTDHLHELAHKLSKNPPEREMDMLLSVGERIAIALLTIAISERGVPAISFTGSQVGIITNTDHTRARILEIKGDRLRQELHSGKVVVVAGYQGVSTNKEITTLGRGGSDTTAVALAAALEAERCEIFSDVDGVYTANPRKIEGAKLIPELDHGEMLTLAEAGSQVLKASAVEFAKRHNIVLSTGSSFNGYIGTIITDSPLDRKRFFGVATDENVARLTIRHKEATATLGVLTALSREGIALKLMQDGPERTTLIVHRKDVHQAFAILNTEIGGAGKKTVIERDENVGLVSVVGVGIGFGTDIASRALATLSEQKITPSAYHFSERRLTFALSRAALDSAAQYLHDAFKK